MQFHKISILVLLEIIWFTYADTTMYHLDTNMNTNTNKLNDCHAQVCSYNNPEYRYVHFPFRIQNDSLPNYCGYPGFDLLCDDADKLLVHLPANLGTFFVQAIEYDKQEIWLNDPKNCLPKKLLTLNFTNFYETPFSPIQNITQAYWLYNCSIDYFKSSNNNKLKPIPCLSTTKYGVVASSTQVTSNDTSSMCVDMGTIQIPIGSSSNLQPLDLSNGLRLSWADPGCKKCYMMDGRCGYKNYPNLELGCFDLPRRGLSKGILLAIALAFAAPSVFVACCLTFFSAKACLRRRNGNNVGTTAVTPQPEPEVVRDGLDLSIIESYPKVVIGESRRLPKPDEKSCPICLGEYVPKESLRTMPDCGHVFHAQCVDEWLQLKASCPVCRSMPPDTLHVSTGS